MDLPVWQNAEQAWVVTRDLWKSELKPLPGGENLSPSKKLFIEKINERNWPEFITALSLFLEAEKNNDRKFAGLLFTFIQKRWRDVSLSVDDYIAPPQPKEEVENQTESIADMELYRRCPPILQFKLALKWGLNKSNYEDWCPLLSEDEELERRRILKMTGKEWAEECKRIDLELDTIRKNK